MVLLSMEALDNAHGAEAVDRINADISSVSFVTFNVAATFFRGHPYIWHTTACHDTICHDIK